MNTKSFLKLRAFIALAFVAILSMLLNGLVFSPSTAKAADLSQFDAGNIISDSKFFDGSVYSATDVQNFLNLKVPTCTINNGVPSHQAGAAWGSTRIADTCLKNYSQQTPNMAAQPGYCAAYPGSPRESAATIIAKVGQVCNISQKVLLVLLEKEQSLISDSWPTVRQISQATGFACYDNGEPCVVDYAGFFYQVWSAARQLQRYGTGSFTWYPVGQTSNIAYQANAPWCGYKSVTIQNRATAALYYYTPYTPNTAALNAGYGTGDSCSAYGNRNFYQLYVDWFGSTKGFEVKGAIATKYNDLGGASSYLGVAKSAEMCGLKLDGCWQTFAGGHIFNIPSLGTFGMNSSIRSGWAEFNNENGWLSYPTMSTQCGLAKNGCYQRFQNGYVFWSSGTGANSVKPEYRAVWNLSNNENGWLGYPTAELICGLKANGCKQQFEGGVLVKSNSGIKQIKKVVQTLWNNYGNENGVLGYPTSDPSNNTTTYTQTFEGGTITVTNGVAAITASTDPWISELISNPWLGNSITTKSCTLRNSGCSQQFQNGYLFFTPTLGAHVVKPEVRTLWNRYSNENGVLGYPTSDPSNNTTTYTQTFEGGTITVTNGVAAITASTDPWISELISNPWLGNSVTTKSCTLRNSGCFQQFQNGYLFYTPKFGAHVVKPEVRTLWNRYSNENGVLGYPTSDPSNNTTTYTQTFEGGTITVTNGVAAITASTDPWISELISNPWLGNSVTPKYCTLRISGCFQQFQNGYLFYTPKFGAHTVKPEVRTLWNRYSNENGVLGYPTSDPSNNTTTYTQTFEGGTITVTNGVARRN